MQLPWKALIDKAWTWLRPRVVAEIEQEVAKQVEQQVEKRQGDPLRRTDASVIDREGDQAARDPE